MDGASVSGGGKVALKFTIAAGGVESMTSTLLEVNYCPQRGFFYLTLGNNYSPSNTLPLVYVYHKIAVGVQAEDLEQRSCTFFGVRRSRSVDRTPAEW